MPIPEEETTKNQEKLCGLRAACMNQYLNDIQYLKRCVSFVKMNKLFLLNSFLHVVNKMIDLRCFNKITSLKNYD